MKNFKIMMVTMGMVASMSISSMAATTYTCEGVITHVSDDAIRVKGPHGLEVLRDSQVEEKGGKFYISWEHGSETYEVEAPVYKKGSYYPSLYVHEYVNNEGWSVKESYEDRWYGWKNTTYRTKAELIR